MPARVRRARAFGLELECDFEAPGLPLATGPAQRAPTRLTLATPEELRRAWPRAGSDRLEAVRAPGGRLLLSVDHHPEAGYRWAASGYGRYVVSPDGLAVRLAPYSVASWRWQRMLISRVLPFAATLQGLEVLHASAVKVGGSVIAILAPGGVGKTSVAINMVLLGARFVTDDVLAVERDGARVLAHPGLGLAGVRPAERRHIEAQLGTLGPTVSRGSKTHVELAREHDGAPLDTMIFLRRGAAFERLTMETVERVSSHQLLAHAFDIKLRTPERLLRQLDLCALLARTARVVHADVPLSVGARAVAQAVLHDQRAR